MEDLKKDFSKTLEEKAEKIYKKLVQDVKHKINTFAPKPVKDMLNTEEGTYFLLSILVIILIGFLRIIGGMLSFILKVILLIATLSAIFFALVYFFSHS